METEKHFLDMSKEEQIRTNEYDLKEMKMYYGSWESLRDIIKLLEENENEAAWERAQNQSQ